MLKMILKSLMLAILVSGFSVLSADAQTPPSAAETQAFRNRPCSDPWINFAYAVEFKRSPVGEGSSVGECNVTLYRDGSWSSYRELRDAVVSVNSDIANRIKLVKTGEQYTLVFKDFDGMIKLGIVGSNAGALISKDGGSLVGLNGSNITLRNNPANVVANGGNNIIAAGGGNFSVISSKNAYGVQTTGAKKVINLRNGAKIVIR